MKYSDYLKLEAQFTGELARSHRGFFLLRETIVWAGIMALVLTIADTTPWPLGNESPFGRLFFILMWSIAMAWIELNSVRRRAANRTKPKLSSTDSSTI
jgi:hypothetical protein